MSKLVALRPNATVDHEINGVVFKIGVLPRQIYLEFLDATQDIASGKAKTSKLFDLQMKVVKWGVKGHEGFNYSDGEEVEFEVEARKLGNKTYDVLTDETLEAYYSAGVVAPLALRLMKAATPETDQVG